MLVPDRRRVALIAYSFWANVLGLLVLLVPEVLYLATGIDSDPRFLWLSALGLLLFGLVGRLVQQRGSALANLARILAVALLILLAAFLASHAQAAPAQADPAQAIARPASEAETLAIALPLVARLEGKRNQAYRDSVGVVTICYGSTRGVRMGDYRSDAQCRALLLAELREYRQGLHGYFTASTRLYRLPPSRDAAFVSFAINVGIAGAGGSTAVRRLNRGDLAGSCQALTWWNQAGGRVLRGLVARRAEEAALCRIGLQA